MAAPLPTSIPVGPDTLITVKVIYNYTSRRFKIPLRDLGAHVFPQKLRELLSIPSDVAVDFERYSDSAVRYVRLDSEDPAVYKQLYRAAKAKLKLRIKAVVAEVPEATAATPQNTELSSPAQQEDTDNVPSVPDLSSQVKSEILPAVAPSPRFLPAVAGDLNKSEALISSPSAELFNKGSDQPQFRYRVFTLGQDTRSHAVLVPSHNSANGAFCIDCNHCGQSIPNEHYHCSICDDGDYDLCQQCVDSGVSCNGDDHWLIKRFVNDGIVTNSTTETIAPRKAEVEAENTEKNTEPVSAPAPELPSRSTEPIFISSEKPQEANDRTCNACFKEFDESKMVSCEDCEDYDLCLTCLLKDSHGHSPAHVFSLIRDQKFCLKNLVLARCRPGRQHAHAAVCDGCDKRILGVRHKCLTCPDWDYCWECVKESPINHPGHRFVPIYGAIAEPSTSQEVHYVFCDGPLCKNKPATYITGVRYKCAVCHDTDFCAACEALPTNSHNRTHPLIKFKTPVRSVSVSTFGDDGGCGNVLKMGDDVTPTVPFSNLGSNRNHCVPEAQTELIMDDKLGFPNPQEDTTVESKDSEHEKSVTPASEPPLEDAEYHALFIRDTIADGSKVAPNQVLQQTWTLHNPGPLVWPAGCSVHFVGGDSMFNLESNVPSSLGSIKDAMESNRISEEVKPGSSADFTVTLKAPRREGTAISYWRLKLPDGTPFGHRLWCDLSVSSEASQSTPVEPAETSETKLEQPDNTSREDELHESAMIFPRLDKESPVASSHEAMPSAPAAPVAPSLTNTDEQDLLEDVEHLTLDGNDSDNGYLTDEEYDILCASDQEYQNDNQSGVMALP
ncbi:ZZ type zinc finger domain protein [Paecilomyces variotii No. 5]|uniref:ZZ type zinc finger domain protein n=1 Tax=Byssochlamys spectabilis (strain No. 5 / NBRC 109023) TaxID=1356009 RepID=V5F8E0_BYSSN|nr:ZZ type zinc finger domain protein [Paecilomyces variotii No. 5]